MAKTQLNKEIGFRFQTARKRSGLTQQEIADRIGVSRTTVANWERGERVFEFSDLVKILPILDVSPNYFLGLGENDPAQYLYSPIAEYGISGVERLADMNTNCKTLVVSIVNTLLQRNFSELQLLLIKSVVASIASIDMKGLLDAYIKQQLSIASAGLGDKIRESVNPDGRIKYPAEVQADLDAEFDKIRQILIDAGYEAGISEADDRIESLSDAEFDELPSAADYDAAYEAGLSERKAEYRRTTGDWDDQ